MTVLYWAVYVPLIKLLGLLFFWLPLVQKRRDFENKNSDSAFRADLAFEFSSEGEFQQIIGLVEDALKLGKKIELIYFSPSVERGVENFVQKHPGQVRALRFPILAPYTFNRWLSAKRLILVRYDFFPDILMWARGEGHELVIVSASFKKDRSKGRPPGFWKRLFFREAKTIVYATDEDRHIGAKLGFEGRTFDFRIETIRRRVETREEKFRQIFPEYGGLKAAFEKYPKHKRLIIGNAWPSDLQVLQKIPDDYYVLVVPHLLNESILMKFKGFNVLNKKGVLCELYADFGKAYVGGGFETSVHSILEPLVAGPQKISCGPIHHRSTEYDVAESFGRMTEINSSAEFLAWLEKGDEDRNDGMNFQNLLTRYPEMRKEVIRC